MASLSQIIHELNLKILTDEKDFDTIQVNAGYCSDLLSCVMAGAPNQGVWITLQAHNNIIAVAALLDLAAIIITEGATPDKATIQKANEEEITLLSTDKSSYYVNGKLWDLGLRAE